MSTYEILNLVIMTTSAVFLGVTLIYLSKQIKLSIVAHSDTHDWNRRIETQKVLNVIKEIDTNKLNEKFKNLNRKEPIPLEEFLRHLRKINHYKLISINF